MARQHMHTLITDTYVRTCNASEMRVQTRTHLCVLHNCGDITPTCLRPATFQLVSDGRSHRVGAGDELLMAATWHCHVVFSMTVASVSIFASVVHTW